VSELVVHGVPGSPYYRSALLGLEEKGLPYRLSFLKPGDSKTPEHLARHPFGRIPVLEHGGFSLYETQAILRYVDTLSMRSPLQPQDPQAAARMNQIVGIVDWYVFPTISVKICAERLLSELFWQRPTNEETVAAAVPQARVCIRELDRLRGSSTFMAGDSVSIADLMLVPHIEFFTQVPEGQTLLKGTAVEEWLARMRSRPSMKATERDKLMMKAA
jgi:glutathione S-transferase